MLCVTSVCASDLDSTNSTLDATGEIEPIQSDEADNHLSDDSTKPIDNLTLSQNYGVEGEEVEITPIAIANGVKIPGNVTFYSDNQYSNEIGALSTEGGILKLPLITSNSSAYYYPFYYIFDGEYNNVKYHGGDYLYFFIMEQNAMDLEYNITKDGLTLTVTPPIHYKSGGENSLIKIYVDGKENASFPKGSFTYTMAYTNSSEWLDIYVAYEGYVNQTSADYYAPCKTKHLTAVLTSPRVSVVNSTYENVQLKVSSPAKYEYYVIVRNGTGKSYKHYMSFFGPGEKTITVYSYLVGKFEAVLCDYNSGAELNLIEFNISQANSTISLIGVGGNNTILTAGHSITLFAQGKGKFTTNASQGEYDVGQTINLTNLRIGKNVITLNYSGDDYYAPATKEIVFLIDKFKSEVSLDLNSTNVSLGEKIKITPTVTVNGKACQNGTVVLYNQSDVEIGRIDLSSASYYEYEVLGGPDAIYAIYLETPESHQSPKSKYVSYEVKELNITLIFDGDYDSYLLTSGSIHFNVTVSGSLFGEPLRIYNGDENIFDLDSTKKDFTVSSIYLHKGLNDFYVRLAEYDDSNPIESNHIDGIVYEQIDVIANISLDAYHIIDGQQALATVNVSYYNSTAKQWIGAPGCVTLFDDNGQYVADLSHGDSWIYEAVDFGYPSSSISDTFSYRYNDYIDGENFIYYVPIEGNCNFTITSMHANSMNLTVNGKNDKLNLTNDEAMALKVDLKYYNLNNTSGILIYVDGVYYGEFNLTSQGRIEIAQITISDVGDHEIYAYYRGYNSSDAASGASSAPAKSNSIHVHVDKTKDVDFNVSVSNDAPEYGQTITLTSSVFFNGSAIADGKVRYYVGENPISPELAIGETSNFTVNQSSEFIINAKYSGYGYYLPKGVNIIIHAKKVENSVNLTIQNMTYGENVNISISQAVVDGIYTVCIGDENILLNVTGGIGFNTTAKLNLPAGDDYIGVVSFDNPNYNTTASARFNITKVNSMVEIISCESVIYGDDVFIWFYIENMTQAFYEIRDEKDVVVRSGSVESDNITISGLPIGEYTVTIINIGDENHTSSNESETFKVERFDSSVNIDMDNFAEFNHENISISFTAEYPTLFHVIIEDSDFNVVYDKTTSDNFVHLNLTGDSFGNLYWIMVYNLGNETVYPSYDMKAFEVFRFDANKSIDIPTKINNNESFDIGIKLTNNTNGNMTVRVDNQEYNVTVNNGNAKIEIKGLTPGVKTLWYTYFGYDVYGWVKGSITFTVFADSLITNNKNIKMIYTDGTKYKVRVYGEDGKLVVGKYVTFKINNKKIKVKTNKKGYASLKITYPPKKYKITATYKNAKATNKITVKHILKSKNIKVKKSAKKIVLKASLKKVKGKYLKGKVIKFKFKGKTYKVKTNKKGIAQKTLNKKVIKNLKKGKTYKVKVTYLKDTIKKKIKVK